MKDWRDYIYYEDSFATVLCGDVLEILPVLPSELAQSVITSPPYFGLRDYDHPDQIGAEKTPAEYIEKITGIFSEVRRVLRVDGTLWLNLGDSFASDSKWGGQTGGRHMARLHGETSIGRSKQATGLGDKQLMMIPHKCAIALQENGWIVRMDNVWHKPNPMTESVSDRPTKSHEYMFLMAKSKQYFYDQFAVSEPAEFDSRSDTLFKGAAKYAGGFVPTKGANTAHLRGHERWMLNEKSERIRNKRSVWTVPTKAYNGFTKTVRQVYVPKDAASGDTKRITSLDCPIHAGLHLQESTVSHDEHAADLSSHNQGNEIYHEQEPLGAPVPIVQTRALDSEQQSLSWLPLEDAETANQHSNQSHKTDRVPETIQPCNASAQSLDRTRDTLESHDKSEPHHDKDARNTLIGDSVSHHNQHKADDTGSKLFEPRSSVSALYPPECTCSFYNEVTEKTSHFAVFPENLITPCILAGTSEAGGCVTCNAPRTRQTVKELPAWENARPQLRTAYRLFSEAGLTGHHLAAIRAVGLNDTERTHELKLGGGKNADQVIALAEAAKKVLGGYYREFLATCIRTVGWAKTCDCPTFDTQPNVVLDPFGGSGTTAMVAKKLNRRSILIELNPVYCAQIVARIQTATLPLFEIETENTQLETTESYGI